MNNTDKEKLIKSLQNIIDSGWGSVEIDSGTVEDIIALLKEQEAKIGHWIIVEYDTLTCSCCGKSYYTGCDSTKEATANLEKGNVYRYCPYCGAKMEDR